jgi:hypothetical protein
MVALMTSQCSDIDDGLVAAIFGPWPERMIGLGYSRSMSFASPALMIDRSTGAPW